MTDLQGCIYLYYYQTDNNMCNTIENGEGGRIIA